MGHHVISRQLLPAGRHFTAARAARLTIFWAVAAAIAASVPGPAGADDRWTTPFPGVRYLYRRASGPRQIHALVVDLCAAGVSFRATRESERRQTVPSFASARSAFAAINGDFFSYETYLPSGAAVGESTRWGHADSNGNGFVALGREQVWLSARSEAIDPIPGWVEQLVSGHPAILRDGEILSPATELCTVRHPRTMVGMSQDRQTLILAVVDGRSSSSIGMTCREEAALLRELGAHDGLNLDGGGSSTMWIRGSGVVNDPSDGSPRVVSNHLALFARGSGVPRSCQPWEPEEVSIMAGAIEPGTSDLDGDGRADVCVRASAGLRCHLANGEPFGAEIAGPELADARGWNDPANYETIRMGDVTGDGRADVCARANAGIRCYPSTGAAFGPAIVGPELSDDSGWGNARYHATLRLADVDGDGKGDLCGRAAAGFLCWRSTGTAFGEPSPALAALADEAGFDRAEHYGTLRMGDVHGDGLADVCARGAAGFDCWLSTGVDFDPAPIEGPRWSNDSGWSAHRHYGTIRLADVDADGRADACGRGVGGYRCSLSTGDGFAEPVVLDAVSDASGWNDIANYSTLRLADIDGDRDLDLCGRADAGLRCWPWDGAGFGAVIAGPAMSDENGWLSSIYYRTIRFGDIDGDGDEDVCARASSGFKCWPAVPGGFDASIAGPAWSNDEGFWPVRFHSTIRMAGPRRAPPEEPPPPPPPPPPPDAGPAVDQDGGATPMSRMPPAAGGCSAGGEPAAWSWPWLAFAILGLRRRRQSPAESSPSRKAASSTPRRSAQR